LQFVQKGGDGDTALLRLFAHRSPQPMGSDGENSLPFEGNGDENDKNEYPNIFAFCFNIVTPPPLQ
jgi:hypothetical protein